MASLYIGVYKALYDYEANTDEELTIAVDDLLYLMQKSDIDEWWTVKKRLLPVDGQEVEEPVGLIPSNYIGPAPVISQCEALYDYTKQTDEELSFSEGEHFDIYDMNDPDWYLVGNGTVFGFVPSNYIKTIVPGSSAEGALPVNSIPQRPIADFAPPPVHKDRIAQQQTQARAQEEAQAHEQEPAASASVQSQPQQRQSPSEYVDVDGHSDVEEFHDAHSEEDAPPPMPSRPTADLSQNTNGKGREQSAPPKPAASSSYEPEESVGTPHDEHGFDGEYFRWYIDEVDGRKKRPIVLAIGNGLIIIKPKSTNPKKLKLKSASTLDNNWRIRDMINFNHEKKHVFLDLRNPDASIELHAGSKDVAEAIVSVLGDLKGAEEAKGLKEVARAASTKSSASNRRVGKLLFDFKAQGHDELSVKEDDEVYIVDSSKSKEWWLCERTSDGRQGVIPSSYIEIVATTNLDKLTDGVQRRKSERSSATASSSKGKVVGSGKTHKHHYRTRDDRDKIRESDRKKRSETTDHKDVENMPNFHRVRTWIDSSGTFKVEAEFLGCMEGKIHLHKTNGVKIAVAATKLSIEDLEYVEKVTGTSLQKYKDEVARQVAKREKAKTAKQSPAKPPQKSATAVINDVAPPKPDRSKAPGSISQSEPDYDWFEFFLSCGVDIGNCQRYSINFSKEQMDETILEDITPSLLRSLGLREGDILRVMKHLDNKFDRKKPTSEPSQSGGLFIEPTGALKNNSTTELSKVTANALPVPSPMKEQQSLTDSQDQAKTEEDAWAVKPAARSDANVSKRAPTRPQYTGSLQDLVDVKPLEANKPPAKEEIHGTVMTVTPSAPPLTPIKTGPLAQPDQQYVVQKTGSSSANFVQMPPNRTGTLIPIPTGGLIPVQPTGFIPITAQPTGFVPIQPTGGLVAQPTYGFVPLQTGITTFAPQKTGPTVNAPPPTSFSQVTSQPTASFVPLQPGVVTQPQVMPATTFMQAVNTGGNNVRSQTTGGLMQNSFVPQSTFGKQITGGFMPSNQTGGMFPQTSFGGQVTGGMMPQTSFGAQATSGLMPQQSFGGQATGGAIPSTSFGGQATGGMMPQTSFGNQMTGSMMPQTSFGNQITGGMMPQTSFGAVGANPQPFAQTQNQFNTGMNQMTNMFQNTSLNGSAGQQQTSSYGQTFPQQTFGQQIPNQATNFFQQQPTNMQPYGQQQPLASFGQAGFEGFGNQPLQAQPTGHGFGNAPDLQAQPTGRRANLQAATADNPFGF